MAEHPGLTYRIISVRKPLLWPRSTGETWILNPPTRYVVTSDSQSALDGELESWSDLKTATYYKPLLAGRSNLAGTRILVCRHYDRGVGDLLFVTGILEYLQHTNVHSIQVYMHAPTDKGMALHGNPALKFEMPLAGPPIYDSFPAYNYHWCIESATEYDEEPEQQNVYDALFKQIGVDYETVNPRFKRPVVVKNLADQKRVDELFKLIFFERKEDWRRKPYWIVSPLTYSTLRSMSYVTWLNIITELAKSANVLVVGAAPNNLMPEAEISYSDFYVKLTELATKTKNIVNFIGRVPMRLTIGLIAGAEGVLTLDSGALYMAQGLRTPAISIWGPQHPHTRIGYDPQYMDLALWKKEACQHAPCFAYRKFPDQKCPRGSQQVLCEPLIKVEVSDVMALVEKVRSRS